MAISKLEGKLRRARRDGWAKYIRTPVDERALLAGFDYSFERYDQFRYFVENHVKLSKGRWAGQPMQLLDWHDEVCGSIFGWVDEENLRRFRRAYIEVPKKNSKSTLAGAIGCYLLNDGEPGAEVYSCANDKSQASIVWNTAADIVEADSDLSSWIEVYRSTYRLVLDPSSWFAAWSSEAGGKDGPNAYAVICDELHEWKGPKARSFWRKIRYAGAARDEPLVPIVITTAGDDRYSLCFEQHQAARGVLEGTSNDMRLFAAIYAADLKKIKEDPDYWKTEECWKEANPAYEVILKKEDFQADVETAERDPHEKAAFFRYRLNVWTESATPWLDPGVWAECGKYEFTENDLEGETCYAGLDLSSVNDFTSACYVFPMAGKERRLCCIWRFFVPEQTLEARLRKDSTGKMRQWVEDETILATPGSAIDHQFIFDQLAEDSKRFKIAEVAYDRNSAAWIVQEMQKKFKGTKVFPFSQATWAMSETLKMLTAAVIHGRIAHGNNEVAAWMANNVAVVKVGAQQNIQFHKGKSRDHIDGMIALAMGFAHAEIAGAKGKKKSMFSSENFEKLKEELKGETA